MTLKHIFARSGRIFVTFSEIIMDIRNAVRIH